MLRGRLLHVGLLALVVLLVSFGQTEAQIGFRYKPSWEKLVDPIRYGSQMGFTHEAWDSTSIDTTVLDSSLMFPAFQDSVLADSLRVSVVDSAASEPSAVSPQSPSAGTGTSSSLIPPTSTSTGTTPTTGQDSLTTTPPGTVTTPPDLTKVPKKKTGKPSLTPGLQDIETLEEVEEEEPPEWHPTIIRSTGALLDFSTEVDTATGYIIMTPKLDGVPMPISGAMSQDLYLERSVGRSDRETWRRSVLKKLPKADENEGGAIEISIPVFKGKWADRIFGGRDVGLTVSGDISINGGLRTEKRDENDPNNTNQNDVKFKIDQTQRFNIKGKVGEKVSVEIDQDSERLFEFENNLRVTYTGNPDEIIQKIEAGNVNLSLPGAKFVSGSGRHQGLFGVKVESQIGALKLITVASLDKSEKQTKKIEGGAESSGPKRIDPNDFVRGRYYFLDMDYREAYKHRHPVNMTHYTEETRQIIAYEVYKSVRASTQNLNAVPGWALFDLSKRDSISDATEPNREKQRGLFSRLTPGQDYELNTDLGYIRLNQFIDSKDILAIAYKTRGGFEYGDLVVPEDPEVTPFVLKLLKPQDPVSSDPTWDLMWRHVYDLGSTGIEWEGFEGIINKATNDENKNTSERLETYDVTDGTFRLVYLFGLDQFGATGDPNPDDLIDRVFVNTSLGELEFPDLKPFDPEGWYYGTDRSLPQINPMRGLAEDSLLFSPDLYTSDEATLNKVISDFQIVVKYQNVSATYDLGFMVLEGSEEVTLNGHRLNKGTDYNIDYVGGNLTILNREATAPGAKLEIKYETGQMMQLDTKTVLGIRAQYELWEDSYIGSTVMYRSEKSLDQRIRLGAEPLQNSIWDINASLNFKPHFLTRAVDWLPLIETNEPSSFTIEGEIAQVYPNPNSFNSASTGDNNGVAYIDDFESIKRSVPLGIVRKLWTDASFPDHHTGLITPWLKQRGRVIWYNPLSQERIKDIWPDREVQAQASKTNILKVEFQPWWTEWDGDKPEDLTEPDRSWGGIMRYLGAGFANQSESKYIEIWLNRLTTNQGYIYIDLGQISEDVIPNGKLDTEDRPTESLPFGNSLLESDEDTGLDLVALVDPLDSLAVNEKGVLLPSYDDYKWDRNNIDDNSFVNGQQGNMFAADGGKYPDTEDLDGDTYLDQTNSYFRYKIDLSEGDNNKYIAGGLENDKGWRLYRIPLSDTLIVGRPSMTSIEYVRMWFTGIKRKSAIKIAQIEIVGNEWLEVEDKNADGKIEPISIAVINTHDNPEYSNRQPPGVAGELDPVTGLRAKEQSLVMKVNRLGPGETGMIYKHMQKSISLLDYKFLKMYVHGGDFREQLTDRFNRALDLEMFIRIGYDSDKKFYEYSQRLNPGWHKENEVIIDLERLSSIKFLREQDSTRNYDILPNGDVMRVVGSPSLSEIKDIVIGVKNHGREISRADGVEIWFDELRVSDVNRDPGWAARGSMSLDIADLITLSADISQEDANFHSVDKRGSSNKKDKVLSGDFQAKFAADKFFDPLWGLRIPISAQFSNDISVPKYKPSSDIKMSSLGGEPVDIYAIFSETLFKNDRMSDNPIYTSPTDSLIGIKKSYSINSSFGKSKKSDNPYIKYTFDKISLSINHREDFSSDSRNLYKNGRQNKASMGYEFSFDEPLEYSWLKWAGSIPWLNKYVESTFRPLPRSLAVNFNGTESYTVSKTRTNRENITDRVAIDRGLSTNWSPLDMLSFTFREQINADRVEEDSMRTYIAQRQVEIDSSDYFHFDPDLAINIFDTTAYDSAAKIELDRIKDELFWNLFGQSLIDNSLTQSFSTSFKPDILSWLHADANYNANYRWNWSESFGAGDRRMGLGTSLTTTASFGLTQLVNAWNQKVESKGGGGTGPTKPDPFGEKDPFKGNDPFGDSDPFKPENDPFKPDEDPFKQDNTFGESVPLKGTQPLKKGQFISSGPKTDTNGVPIPDMSLTESPDSLGTVKDSVVVSKEPPKKRDVTRPIRMLLGRLQDIRYQYTQSNDVSNTSVGRGQAKWGYRLGFERDPGVDRVEGFYPRDTHNRREEHSVSSGLTITPNLRFNNLTYDFSTTRNIGSDGSESGTDSRTVWQYFGDDGVTIETVPILNWSASWSGLGDFDFVKRFATSVNLENSFRGSLTETWRGYSHPDSQKTPTRIDYEKGFSPLAGMSISWIGGVSSNLRYNMTERVNDERTGRGTTNKTTSESINLTASYNAKKGFSVPIPMWPFKNRRFKNSTNFSLNYTYSHEVRQTSGDGKNFEETDKTKSWSVSPSMEYTFSNTVRGGFQYEYGVRQSKRVPDVTSQEFSFRVNISIRG